MATTYSGAFAGGGGSGIFSITVPIPAAATASVIGVTALTTSVTGRFQPGGAAIVPITGDFDTGTGALALRAPGFTITAKLENDTVNGTYVGPNAQIGVIAALVEGNDKSVAKWCGSLAGALITTGHITIIGGTGPSAPATTNITVMFSYFQADGFNETGIMNGVLAFGSDVRFGRSETGRRVDFVGKNSLDRLQVFGTWTNKPTIEFQDATSGGTWSGAACEFR